jgi:hypothetical protein
MSTVDEERTPVITVVRGRPTQDELAALVPVLLAAGSAAEPADAVAPAVTARATARVTARAGAWTDRARAWHALPRPGPHAWRAAALPR